MQLNTIKRGSVVSLFLAVMPPFWFMIALLFWGIYPDLEGTIVVLIASVVTLGVSAMVLICYVICVGRSETVLEKNESTK